MANSSDTKDSVVNPFDTELKLPTRPNGTKKDAEPPPFGRLDPTKMAQPGALDGPPEGAETAYIKGTQTALVTVDRTTIVNRNEDHTVSGTQDEHVSQQATHTFFNGRDVVVHNEEKLSVNGTQEIFVLGESEEHYMMKHEVHAPQEFEYKLHEQGLTVGELKFLGVAVSVRGNETVAKVRDVEVGVWHNKEGFVHGEAHAAKGEAAAATNKDAVTADVNARVDVAPSVGTGTPVR